MHYPHMSERMREEAHVGSKRAAPSELVTNVVEPDATSGSDPQSR